MLSLANTAEREAAIAAYRRFREYIEQGRNHVWRWYISNLVQPIRLAQQPARRLVGNPPWVTYNSMVGNPRRQTVFREQAQTRGLWAGASLASKTDLAATFVATCVDYYLQTGGKFGFVLPYSALRGRQWEPFRSGDWSVKNSERGTHVDLSRDAWDFQSVSPPPFPSAHSSVIFGTKIRADRQNPSLQPLQDISKVVGKSVDNKLSWHEVRPLLNFNKQRVWQTEASATYSSAFRNGATLFPQALVTFDQPKSRALGMVYFKTNESKGAFKGKAREGQVEERFIRTALFSKHLIPFGITGNWHVIAPFSDDGGSLMDTLPQGSDSIRFRHYWDTANREWRNRGSDKPPHTLADRLDYGGNLSAQLENLDNIKVVYNKSGKLLIAAIVDNTTIIDNSLVWASLDDPSTGHYLASIFNAPALLDFFVEGCQASDKDFTLLPPRRTPIPAFDANNPRHTNLVSQSQLAHQRVADLVAERQAADRRITRNDVLRDRAMRPIFDSIDASVRAIQAQFGAHFHADLDGFPDVGDSPVFRIALAYTARNGRAFHDPDTVFIPVNGHREFHGSILPAPGQSPT